VAIGVLPWLWETYTAVISGAFPVLVAVSAASTLAHGLFGFLSLIPGFPNFIIDCSVSVISAILWVIAIIVAVIADVIWALPVFSIGFWVIAAVWIILGLFMGLVAYLGQAIILIASAIYGLFLFGLGILLAISLAVMVYGIEYMLGPLNLIITALCSILSIPSLIFCGIPAIICFFVGGVITLITQSVSWLWNYIVLLLVDCGAGLGGLCALEGPVNLIIGMFGLGMVVLGIVLSLTIIGSPVGIPMVIFGLIIAVIFLIVGTLGCGVAFVAQFPIIQNALAAWTVLFVLILYALYLDLIWWLFDLIVYLVDFIIGVINGISWFLWTSCTSICCIFTLCPPAWAISSFICSICSFCSLPTLIGLVLDVCSWAFLIVQNALYWLWHLFFQSSMD